MKHIHLKKNLNCLYLLPVCNGIILRFPYYPSHSLNTAVASDNVTTGKNTTRHFINPSPPPPPRTHTRAHSRTTQAHTPLPLYLHTLTKRTLAEFRFYPFNLSKHKPQMHIHLVTNILCDCHWHRIRILQE